MRWEEARQELLQDPEIRRVIEEGRVENEIGIAIIAARLEAGLSQKELADRIGTGQANISRLESGEANPRLSTLKKLATELDTEFLIPPMRREAPEKPISIPLLPPTRIRLASRIAAIRRRTGL